MRNQCQASQGERGEIRAEILAQASVPAVRSAYEPSTELAPVSIPLQQVTEIMSTERKRARSFPELLVWRKAHEFVLEVYGLTAAFPKTESYGLTSQLRRAAVSIPANIAEGFRRRSAAEKVRFLNIAEGSIAESDYYLILSRDLGYGRPDKLIRLLDETSRLVAAYSRAIRNSGTQPPRSYF
jgi:four helix bundle protein